MYKFISSIRYLWLTGRLIYHTLFVIRFPIIMASIGAVVLYSAQGQDILRYLAESEDSGDALILTLLTQLCGLVVWHVSRTLYRFHAHRRPSNRLILTLVTWAPRILAAGVPGFILIATVVAIYVAPEQATGQQRFFLLGLLALATAINFLITWWRRWLVRTCSLPSFFAPGLSVKEEIHKQGLHVIHGLTGSAKRFYFLLLLLSPISIIWVTLNHGRLPEWMGAGAVTMLALALTTVFGSTLSYIAMRSRLPLFAASLFAALLFSALGWNDNHQLRFITTESMVQTQSGMIDDVSDAIWQDVWQQRFGKWEGKDQPVLFVASSGGGVRAAYWTAQVLGVLSAQSAELQQRIFSISGVSGGSVGAAVYAAIQAHHQATNDNGRNYSGEARVILGKDLLTPILATFFFPDIAQRFIPFTLFPHDRAVAGERALEQNWYHAFPNARNQQPPLNPLQQSLLAVAPKNGGNVPYLILNATDLPTGQRVIAHNLSHNISPVFSFAEPDIDYAKSLRLSTAAFLSARFPYITPTGTLDFIGGGGPRQLRLGDGGYFENSGSLSTLEVLERLYIHREKKNMPFIPIVLQIDNDPNLSEQLDQEPPGMISSAPILGQLLDPVTGLLQVRSAHGYRASEGLRQWIGQSSNGGQSALISCDSQVCPERARGYYFHLRLYNEFINEAGQKIKAGPKPLGWLLSYQARQDIECQLLDARNLEQIHKLLAHFGAPLNKGLLAQQQAACQH